MKKIMVVACLLTAATVSLNAQTTNFGIKGGVQQNLLVLRQESGGDWGRQIVSGTGFHVGGVVDIGFSDKFSVQPNLLFNMKSTRTSSETEITLYTVDLPINLLFRNNGFFAGAGPNFSYGISAKQETDGSPENDLYEGDGGDPAEFNRFEIGANVLLGYQFPSGLGLNAHWTPGFSNLNNDDDADESRYSTRTFGLSISYMFGGKKSADKK